MQKKTFDEIQQLFMIKTLNKLGIEGTNLNIIKAMYDKPAAHVILNSRMLKASSLTLERGGGRTGDPIGSFLWRMLTNIPNDIDFYYLFRYRLLLSKEILRNLRKK